MKYVILQGPDGLPVIVMGFAPLTHDLIAEPYIARGCKPVSAGFAMFGPFGDELRAFGESTSLRLKARPDDTKILSAFYRATVRQALPVSRILNPADTPCSQN
jgi:hypothetical protein